MEKLHLEPNLMDLRYLWPNYTWSPNSHVHPNHSAHLSLFLWITPNKSHRTKSYHQHLTMASSAVILPHFDLKKKFFHHANVVEYVENWASVAGFIVRDHPKGNFVEKDWPFEYPFVMKTISRGLFYCSPKSPRRIKRSKCDWRVPYRVDPKGKVYEFIGE